MAFWVSLFFHVVLLAGMGIRLIATPAPINRPPPALSVPSYAYEEKAAPRASRQSRLSKEQPEASTLLPTGARQMVHRGAAANQREIEPIHLIGDKKKVPKPLIKLIGKALTARLIYPKIAADFKLHGKAVVGFVVHPNGSLSHIQLLESSHVGVLDKEALAAVNAISPIANVSPYVQKPKEMIIGIIF